MKALSPRLNAVMSFVAGRTLADIGTDHGYLPIMACKRGLVEDAIACDVSAGPLQKAIENIKEYGLEEKISARLGFGLKPIQWGEADCVVISGMGGMRIIDILKNGCQSGTGLEVLGDYVNRLIVQPQHDIPLVRRTLHEMNFEILDEIMVREIDRFYTIIAAQPQKDFETYTELEYMFGKCLIDKKDELLKAYVMRELDREYIRDEKRVYLKEVLTWL